eukprot:Rmarinus@m.3781
MGNAIGRWFGSWFGLAEGNICMIGLDAAGKTTILYKLRLGEVVNTIPTIGFNVESVQYKNVNLTVWDIGGQDRIRSLWRHYFANMSAVIFVVDSSDRSRMKEARDELHGALSNFELRDVPVMVFANKQDLPGAMNASEMAADLGLATLKGRDWYIQSCCAVNGDGLYEGLDWLSRAVTGHV